MTERPHDDFETQIQIEETHDDAVDREPPPPLPTDDDTE